MSLSHKQDVTTHLKCFEMFFLSFVKMLYSVLGFKHISLTHMHWHLGFSHHKAVELTSVVYVRPTSVIHVCSKYHSRVFIFIHLYYLNFTVYTCLKPHYGFLCIVWKHQSFVESEEFVKIYKIYNIFALFSYPHLHCSFSYKFKKITHIKRVMIFTMWKRTGLNLCFIFTHWRQLDFAITHISHRPQPEYTRN